MWQAMAEHSRMSLPVVPEPQQPRSQPQPNSLQGCGSGAQSLHPALPAPSSHPALDLSQAGKCTRHPQQDLSLITHLHWVQNQADRQFISIYQTMLASNLPGLLPSISTVPPSPGQN